MNLYFMHEPEPVKLAVVTATMHVLGSPTVRVVDCGDYLVALEGMHRLRAACELGVAPQLEVLSQEDPVAADSLDLQGLNYGETYTAGELAGEVYHPGCGCYAVDDDGQLRLLRKAKL